MKYLVVSQFYYPEPFKIHEICEELVKRGENVTVLTTNPNYPEGVIYDSYRKHHIKEEYINGVRVIRCKTIPRGKSFIKLFLSYFSYWIQGERYILKLKKESFDVIYCYQMSPITQVFPAAKAKRIFKCPLFIYCLDLWPESIRDNVKSEKSLLYRLVRKLSINAYSNGDIIGITSKSFSDYLVSEVECDSNKIRYLPQHAENVFLRQLADSEKHEKLQLYYLGNVGQAQNIDLVIRAVYKIKDKVEFCLNIVGGGSCLEDSRMLVQELGLDFMVKFYGRRSLSEMPEFYSKADCFLLPLSNKSRIGLTIPGKLQGYMAAGKPIIGFIGGDAADIIRESQSGVCAKADDIDSLSETLLDFISNFDSYRKCGRNARMYFEENFTLDSHVNKLQEYVSEMDDYESIGNKC